MTVPTAGSLIRRRPWPVLISCTVVSVVASLVRDLVHRPEQVSVGEGAAVVVTVVAGIGAAWALVVLVARRREAADPQG